MLSMTASAWKNSISVWIRQPPIEFIPDASGQKLPQETFSFTLCLRTQQSLSRPITFRFIREFFFLTTAFCIPSLTKSLQVQIGNKIENNRTVSDYSRYSFIIIRKNSWPHEITDVTSVTVLIQKRALEGSWSVVRGAHFQAFTLKLPQDHGRLPAVHISKRSQNSQNHGRLPAVHISKHSR